MRRTRLLTLAALLAPGILPGVWGQGPQAGPAGKDLHGDPLPEGAIARLGTIRWQASGTVSFAALLADGKSVLAVAEDRTIRVWEYPSGKELRRFEQAKAGPGGFTFRHSIALSPDGKVLACHFGDAAVQLHDVARGTPLHAIQLEGGNRGGPVTLDFSPDSKHLAVQHPDGTVRICDWSQNKETQRLGENAQVILPQTVPFLAYSPDGKLLASLVLSLKDTTIVASVTVWDLASGKALRELPLKGLSSFGAAAFSPDSKQLAFTQSDGSLTVVETATGNEVSSVRSKGAGKAPQVGIVSFLFSPDGKAVLGRCNDGTVREWDVAAGKELRQLGDKGSPLFGVIQQPRLTFSSDAKTLVLNGPSRMIRFIDRESGKEINVAADMAAPAPMDLVRFSPDGKRLWTQQVPSHATLEWDVGTGKFLGKLGAKLSDRAVFSTGGRFVLKPDEERGEIQVVDTTTGKVLGHVPGGVFALTQFAYTPNELAISPDGKTIAARQVFKEVIELIDTETGKVRHTLPIVTGSIQRPGAVNFGAPAPPGLLFAPDGKTLVAYATPDKLAQWDVATGRRRLIEMPERLLQAPAHIAAFSPDGRCLALDVRGLAVVLIELATGTERKVFGRPLAQIPIPIGFGVPLGQVAAPSVAFSADGQRLAHAGSDGKVHLWDVTTGEKLRSFAGHRGAITGVAFAADGKRVASVSSDATGLVWDVAALQPAARPVKELTADEAQARWAALEKPSGAAGFQAMGELVASPKQTLALLQLRLQPAAALDEALVQKLLVQLASEQFKDRQQATAELIKLGERVVPALDKALAANPDLEMRKRLETLVERLAGPRLSGEQLRTVRAVEVLERIGTKEAQALLERLAEGSRGAAITTQSRAALLRMGN